MLLSFAARIACTKPTYEVRTEGTSKTLFINGKGLLMNEQFSYYNVDKVVIGEGFTGMLKSTGPMAHYCFPASLKKIEVKFFDHVKSFEIDSKNQYFKVVNGNILSKDGKTFVFHFNRNENTFTVPDGVTSIGICSFDQQRLLTSVFLPDSVTRIEFAAFRSTGLTSITIPKNVEFIAEEAFIGTEITSFSIPESVKCIGYASLSTLSLKLVTISSGVKCIEEYAFKALGSSPSTFIVSNKNQYYKVDANNNLVEKEKSNNKNYKVDENGKLVLPPGITRIDVAEFAKCADIISVEIPKGVTYIGEYSFYNCINLKSLTLHDGVSYIGEFAFCGTSITTLEIPNSVSEIGAFSIHSETLEKITMPGHMLKNVNEHECIFISNVIKEIIITDDLEDLIVDMETNAVVTIQEGVKRIESCKDVNKIKIPASVEYIGEDAISATAVEIDPKNTRFTVDSSTGIITNTVSNEILGALDTQNVHNLVIPANIVNVAKELIDRASDITVEQGNQHYRKENNCLIKDSTVIKIPDNSDTLTIPEGITCIIADYFRGNSISLPSTLEHINNILFTDSTVIDSRNPHFKKVNDFILSGDSKTVIKYLGKSNAVTFPAGITKIGPKSLGSINCESIVIPESVEEIEFNKLKNIQKLTIAGNVRVNNIGTFNEIHVTSDITADLIPLFITSCAKTIILEKGVTKIPDNAFLRCEKLETVQILGTLTNIGKNIFDGCYALKTITFAKEVDSYKIIDGILYNKFDNKCNVVKCISNTKETLILPSDVTQINDRAFEGNTHLMKIVVPVGVTSIGDSAFKGCTKLNEVVIPEGVTSIGDHAFEECAQLSTIKDAQSKRLTLETAAPSKIQLPNSINYIGKKAFLNCAQLKGELNIPKSLKVIGSEAFLGCTKIEGEVTFPSTIESIGLFCLEQSSLTSIKYLGSSPISEDIGLKPDTTVTVGPSYKGESFGGNTVNIDESIKPDEGDPNDGNKPDGGDQGQTNEKKLNGGEIAGIVIGVVVVVAAIVGVAVYFIVFRKSHNKTEGEKSNEENDKPKEGKDEFYLGK